jgi:hypothetical protein
MGPNIQPTTTGCDETWRLARVFVWDGAAGTGESGQPGIAPQRGSKQVRRMLADRKSAALATRFASQWLRLQDLDKIFPDYLLYPQYDDTLARAMKRETELFFDSIVREDRSVRDLLTADYTFVNERLAKHYGIPNITGHAFQRVALPPYRRGSSATAACCCSRRWPTAPRPSTAASG